MSDFTQLLDAIGEGDPDAARKLFALVYADLKALAARQLDQEMLGHSLQPTALVHEAYLKLLGRESDGNSIAEIPWTSRGHFFGAAANAMRQILIEAARRRSRKKRGGGMRRATLEPDEIAAPELADDLLALDEAMTSLAKVEPKVAELVNLRYFGGLTLKEAASAMGIAPRTADSYWAYARAWLLAEIQRMDAR